LCTAVVGAGSADNGRDWASGKFSDGDRSDADALRGVDDVVFSAGGVIGRCGIGYDHLWHAGPC
jgi:hypothetical protein